jgi:hypothetical protein
MQYLDLVRDCIDIFSLEKLLPNDVQTENTVGGAEDDEDDYWYADDNEDETNEDNLNDSNDQDHANDPDESGDDDSDDDQLDDSDEDSDSDSDSGDYTTDSNDKTSKDIKLSTFTFAADDYVFHKNHHNISKPELARRTRKNLVTVPDAAAGRPDEEA